MMAPANNTASYDGFVAVGELIPIDGSAVLRSWKEIARAARRASDMVRHVFKKDTSRSQPGGYFFSSFISFVNRQRPIIPNNVNKTGTLVFAMRPVGIVTVAGFLSHASTIQASIMSVNASAN